MSAPELPRRGFLAATAGIYLGGAGQRALFDGPAPRAFARLDIGPPKGRDVRSRVETRCVEAVCNALAPGLPHSGRLDAAQLRSRVLALYPDASEIALQPEYIWVRILGEWVLWCFATTSFRVDPGEGDVQITLQEWQPLS